MNKAPSHNHEPCIKCETGWTTHKSGMCKECRPVAKTSTERTRKRAALNNSAGDLSLSNGELQ